jgi:uncharacterized membrane-anchored protein
MEENKPTISKVPEVTLMFWVIKVAATTLGETGGDALSMSLNLGYLVSTIIFSVILIVVAGCQIFAKAFHPYLYWLVIVATTTTGTTLADFADRSLGIGYTGGSTLLLLLLLASLAVWYKTMGTVSVSSITSRKAEAFYWATIMFSQTLGTALGDWAADTGGLGYGGGVLVFSACLAAIAAAYRWTSLPHTLLFWAAFILTRPLGATVGDLLDKPLDQGGLNMSRFTASAALAAVMIAGIALSSKKAGSHPKG